MRIGISLLLALLLAPGCSNDYDCQDPTRDAGQVDHKVASDGLRADQASLVPYSFSGLGPFDVVKGTVIIKAAGALSISKLELLANSEPAGTRTSPPYEFPLDTSGWLDGPVRLALRATTPEGVVVNSKILPVMILNYGEEVALIDAASDQPGNSGTIDVAKAAYEDQHLRYWWKVKKDDKRTAVVLFWDDPAFRLELQIGPGQCPEHGPGSIAIAPSSDSPIYLQVADGDGALIPSQFAGVDEYQYFAHVQLLNSHEVLAKKCPFWLKGFTMRAPPPTP
jgi:hypothetical protein